MFILATKSEASGGCRGCALEGASRRAPGRNSAKAELIAALGKRCEVTETKCCANGDPYCEFHVQVME